MTQSDANTSIAGPRCSTPAAGCPRIVDTGAPSTSTFTPVPPVNAVAVQISCCSADLPAVAVRPVAMALDREPLGKALEIAGFIAPKSRRSTRLIVHITEYASSEEN